MPINSIESLLFDNDITSGLPTDLKLSYNLGSSTPPLLVTAGNVQFNTPSSSPIFRRSVDSKLKEYVSVKDFGAIGDGVNNDTVAIQNAVNSGATYIYFPPLPPQISPTDPIPAYKITSTIVINKTITIGGDNNWITKLSFFALNIPFFEVKAESVVFEYLLFQGYDPYGNNNYNNTGIITYASKTVVRDCVFAQINIGICNSIAYLANNLQPDEQSISGCRFINCKYGIQSQGGFINSRIHGYSIFSGCKCAIALYDPNEQGKNTEGVTIESCLIYNCGDEALISSYKTGMAAVDIYHTEYTYIRNCMLDSNTNIAISINNSKYCAISTSYISTFKDQQPPFASTYSGVVVKGDCSELLISDCQIFSCLKWGIEINGVDGFNDVSIIDCTFNNNNIGKVGSGDLYLNGVDNVIVRGCNLLTNVTGGLGILNTLNTVGLTSVYLTETKVVGTIVKSPNAGTKISVILTNCKNRPTRFAGIATFSGTSITIPLPSGFTVLTGQNIVVTATNSSSFEYITAGIQFTNGIYNVRLVRSAPGAIISVNYVAEVFDI